jgi:phenylalanyl-tRNA synthetase beta chain
LRFFEFGKTYSTEGVGKYEELNHLALYVTGQIQTPAWNSQSVAVDFYYLKAVCENLLRLLGLPEPQYTYQVSGKIESGASVQVGGKKLVEFGSLKNSTLQRFGIKQNLFFADFNWDAILELIAKNKLTVKELPKQLPVYRDLAMLVQKSLTYDKVEQAIRQTRLDKLSSYQLFDVFESDKLGAGKKSLALSFTFLDEEKTLTDKEIDNMMQKIMKSLETQVGAEIRKQ